MTPVLPSDLEFRVEADVESWVLDPSHANVDQRALSPARPRQCREAETQSAHSHSSLVSKKRLGER